MLPADNNNSNFNSKVVIRAALANLLSERQRLDDYIMNEARRIETERNRIEGCIVEMSKFLDGEAFPTFQSTVPVLNATSIQKMEDIPDILPHYGKPPKRKLSTLQRKRISASQKKRWAEQKAAKKVETATS